MALIQLTHAYGILAFLINCNKGLIPSERTLAWLMYWTRCSSNSLISGDLMSHGTQITPLLCQGQALNDHCYVRIIEMSGNVNSVILKKVSFLSALRVFWQLPLQLVKTISSIFDISVSLLYNRHLRHILFKSRMLRIYGHTYTGIGD